MQEFNSYLALNKQNQKLPFLWPASLNLSNLNPIPQKYRPSRRLRMRQKARDDSADDSSNVIRLETSFDVSDGVRSLLQHRCRIRDMQHLVVFGFLIFSLSISPSAPFLKLAFLVLLGTLLSMPITRQFFLPSLPIWTYLIYFFTSRFITEDYRTHIWVKVLPALENVLYGANLSNVLSTHTHPILDVVAWIPYGLGHFALPFICSGILFVFAAPGTLPVFARAFGYMNMLGVTIQLITPCTPPWYEKQYGLQPAHYGMPGSPAGLARIDAILGLDLYTTSFTTAPVPFGAFPSLHAGDAILEALTLQHCFPRLRPFLITYVGWICWATMYLNHHYAVDLVGGGLIAVSVYYIARSRWLPRPQTDKSTRWEYEYVEHGDRPKTTDEEFGDNYVNDYGLGLHHGRDASDSDEWTLGSSSSFESLSRGDSSSASSGGSTPGSLSPAQVDDKFTTGLVGDWNQRLSRESDYSEVVAIR